MHVQATDFLADAESLTEFLQLFETGRLNRGIWNHAAHLIVAAAYLTENELAEATDLLRSRIPAYNQAQGVPNTEERGYHETLTVFWATLVDRYLKSLPQDLERLDKIRRAVEHYRHEAQIFRRYWSFDLLKSAEARRRWVPPDLEP